MTDKTKFKHAHLTGQAMRDHWGPIVDRIAADSLSQHCPNCEAQAAQIDYWKTEARNVRRELKSEQKQTDSAMDNYDAMQRRCEAQAAEIEKLREAWQEYFEAKSELADLERAQDLTKRFDEALYKLQYAEDKARAALGETK